MSATIPNQKLSASGVPVRAVRLLISGPGEPNEPGDLQRTATRDVTSLPRRQATSWQFLWLSALILSFSYELPLATLFPYDRLNPRLFDVVLALGILTVLPGCSKRAPLPGSFLVWSKLVFVFAICAAGWFSFLPKDVAKFTLWFAFKYLISLVCLYPVATIPLTGRQKRRLMQLTVAGGLIVSAYAALEYRAGGYVRTLPDGSVIPTPAGVLFSCLGPTYFHVGTYSSISYAMALALANGGASLVGKIGWMLLAGVVVWPALFCGSRAALFGVAIITLGALWLTPRIRGILVLAALGITLLGGYKVLEHSKTTERLEAMEETENNSFWNRLTLRNYSLTDYDSLRKIAMPFIGGGFYVVPMVVQGELNYRVGYGIHNSYLFAVEQGGVCAAFFLLSFILKSAKGLRQALSSKASGDRTFASGATMHFIALSAVALGGQVFWLIDGTVNLMYYQLCLLIIAVCPCVPTEETEAVHASRLKSDTRRGRTRSAGLETKERKDVTCSRCS